MASFYESLSSEEFDILNELIDHIKKLEPHLEIKEGRYMKIESALNFKEEGTPKYSLTKNKNDFSIHNMVIYAFPEVATYIKANSKGMKIHKVIFNTDLKDELYESEYGKKLKSSGIYITRNLSKLINDLHDDHYHVDFVKLQ